MLIQDWTKLQNRIGTPGIFVGLYRQYTEMMNVAMEEKSKEEKSKIKSDCHFGLYY